MLAGGSLGALHRFGTIWRRRVRDALGSGRLGHMLLLAERVLQHPARQHLDGLGVQVTRNIWRVGQAYRGEGEVSWFKKKGKMHHG